MAKKKKVDKGPTKKVSQETENVKDELEEKESKTDDKKDGKNTDTDKSKMNEGSDQGNRSDQKADNAGVVTDEKQSDVKIKNTTDSVSFTTKLATAAANSRMSSSSGGNLNMIASSGESGNPSSTFTTSAKVISMDAGDRKIDETGSSAFPFNMNDEYMSPISLKKEFYSMYQFAETRLGKQMMFVPNGELNIGMFSTLREFVIQYAHLLDRVLSKYDYIYHGIEKQTNDFQQGRNPTAWGKQGMNIMERAFQKGFWNDDLSSTVGPGLYYRTNVKSADRVTDTVVINTNEWERDLIQYLHNLNAGLFVRRPSVLFDYMKNFSDQWRMLQFEDERYEGKVRTIYSKYLKHIVTNNVQIYGDLMSSFRIGLRRSVVESLISISVGSIQPRTQAEVANINARFMVSFVQASPAKLFVEHLKSSISSEVVYDVISVMVLNRWYKLSFSNLNNFDYDVMIVIDLILATMLFNRKDVAPESVSWMQRYLIVNFFKYLSKQAGHQYFNITYWRSAAGASIASPFNLVLQTVGLFEPEVENALAALFTDDPTTGAGWAGDGLNTGLRTPVPPGASNYMPSAKANRAYEPGFGVVYGQNPDPPIPPRLEKLSKLTQVMQKLNTLSYLSAFLKPIYVALDIFTTQTATLQYWSAFINRITWKYNMTNLSYMNYDSDPDGLTNELYLPDLNFQNNVFTEKWNNFTSQYLRQRVRDPTTITLMRGDVSKMALMMTYDKWKFSSSSVDFIYRGWAYDIELRKFGRIMLRNQMFITDWTYPNTDNRGIYRYSETLRMAVDEYSGLLKPWLAKWFETYQEVYPAMDGLQEWVDKYETIDKIILDRVSHFGFAREIISSNLVKALLSKDTVFRYTNTVNVNDLAEIVLGGTIITAKDLGQSFQSANLYQKITEASERGNVIYAVPVPLDTSNLKIVREFERFDFMIGWYNQELVNNVMITFDDRSTPYKVHPAKISYVWKDDITFIQYNFIRLNLTFTVMSQYLDIKTIQDIIDSVSSVVVYSSENTFSVNPIIMVSESTGTL
jgi:hypothetical protein